MRELATLKLDTGDELRVEVERDDLVGPDIVVRRASGDAQANGLLAAVADHLRVAAPHPAGSTDRLLEADRERPY